MINLSSDKYSSQFGGGSQYAYFHEEDETSFQLVDTAKTQKTAYQRNRMRFAQVQQTRCMSPSAINVSAHLKCWCCVLYFNSSHNIMMCVSTEEPAQGQRPQESDSVQHADAPEERQAKREVRFRRSSAFKKCHFLADFLSSVSCFGLHSMGSHLHSLC